MAWEWSRDWPYAILIGVGAVFGLWVLQGFLDLCAPRLLKKCLHFRQALRQLKSALEQSYPDDCWDDPEFCKAYLKVYEKLRGMRNLAKRGETGLMPEDDDEWAEFDNVDVQMLR